MNTDPKMSDASPPDAALRHALRASVTASTHAPDGLQERVLAQWRLRYAETEMQLASDVPGAVAHAGWFSRRVQWRVLAGVVVLVVVAQLMHHQSQKSMDDLLEADVLSLIAVGEL